MERKTHRINVSFNKKDFKFLDYWSKKKGQSLSSFVRLLVKESFEKKYQINASEKTAQG